MFSVGPAERSIPTLRDVPLTREEIAERRRRRAILGVVAGLCALIALYLGYRFYHHRQIVRACEVAESSGRVADIDAAVAMLEGEEAPADVALRARLLATAVLAGETDRREAAEAFLARHDAASDGASDHRIAAAYLALADADPASAAREAALLVAGRGPRAAEAAHARAVTALAMGNLEAAEAAAEAARDDMDGSPRHSALVVEILARRGQAPEAGDASDPTVLHAARAEAALETGVLELAESEAQLVLAAADATPAEHAWAELVLAAIAASRGDSVATLEALARATERPPPGDESFQILVSETWVALGRGLDADRAIEALGSEVSTDASRRALLNARRALLRGDTDAARRAVSTASEGPARQLVEAEIAVAEEQLSTARPLLTTLLDDARLGLRARIVLTRALSRAHEWDAALTTIQPALEAHPADARVVAAAAAAFAGHGEAARARRLLDERLTALPREPLLLLELARLHAQAAQWEEAFAALETAVTSSPTDPVLQLERGLAARALRRLDVAADALTASLATRPGNARALVALFETNIDAGTLDAAATTNAAIEAAGLVSPDIDGLRARFLVGSLAGASGVAAMEAAVGRSPADGTFRLALARLHYQAEQWEEAAESFYAAANRLPDERLLALAYRALSLARARRRPTVEAVLDQIRRETPVPAPVLSVMAVAEGWLERHDDALGRAGIFARLGADRDPESADATFLLAVLDHLARRDASERLASVADVSLEAVGMLALDAATRDAEACGRARRYLRGAPEGHLAAELQAWAAGCPAE